MPTPTNAELNMLLSSLQSLLRGRRAAWLRKWAVTSLCLGFSLSSAYHYQLYVTYPLFGLVPSSPAEGLKQLSACKTLPKASTEWTRTIQFLLQLYGEVTFNIFTLHLRKLSSRTFHFNISTEPRIYT